MSFETPFTKENLDTYLRELAKEFRKLNGKVMPTEIILIGGAAILAKYGFREMTYDIDAVILASSAMKEAVNRVGDKFGLPNNWLNMDFKKTTSYSHKLSEVSVYYKTFSNILKVRTISAEYLIAMKLMSGRQYKYDLSDVAGILWEHQKSGNPITREAINEAIVKLYKSDAGLPPVSKKLLDDAYTNENYERVFKEICKSEIQSNQILMDLGKDDPSKLKKENISLILEKAKKRKNKKGK
jgi:hypothetical protein